jgi:hypothetical protein
MRRFQRNRITFNPTLEPEGDTADLICVCRYLSVFVQKSTFVYYE